MSEKLDIQLCTTADADQISEVAIRSYKDFYLYLWNDDGSWYINRSFKPEQIRKEMEDPNAQYYALRMEDDDIGFMKLNINQPLADFEQFNSLELERIYLVKQYSAKGFGRQAVQYCFNLASWLKKDVVWLKSMDSSEAIHFYKRMGFEECGTYRLDFELMKPEFRGMKILMKKLV